MDHCTRPVVTRSWDGGKTWLVEDVNAPDFSTANIVRLWGGDLLASHHGWINGFVRSTDGGRSWRTDNDTIIPTFGSPDLTIYPFRDYRGILYWMSSGRLNFSLDNGKSFVQLRQTPLYDGFYVLHPDGLMVTHRVGASYKPGSIFMSFNHGRTWSTVAVGYERGDSTSTLYGVACIRDTIAVYEIFGKGDLIKEYEGRTKYWQSEQHRFQVGPYIGSCYVRGGIMDSSEAWFGWSSGKVKMKRPTDTMCVTLVEWVPPGFPIPPDTTKLYEYIPFDGSYYDLDGAVHPNGSLIILPINKPRPVSRIDRLYTCTGVEYVVGGSWLKDVVFDADRSFNALLTYTITPNQRLSTINIVAVDSTKPMSFAILVYDSIVGSQVFVDSVLPISSRPTIAVRTQGNNTYIESLWADGPYMWLHDGMPLQREGAGVNGDTVLVNPASGTYKVMGRTSFGCDVYSNEVVITSTDATEDIQDNNSGYTAYVNDEGIIHVQWLNNFLKPESIRVFDMLGQQLEVDITIGENSAELYTPRGTSFLLVAISSLNHNTVIGVMSRHK